MKVTDKHSEKVANMKFSSVYPHYVLNVEKKGRSVVELHQVIEWLTGYDENQVMTVIDQELTFKIFFERATVHPKAHLIKGVICGYRIEEIDNKLTK